MATTIEVKTQRIVVNPPSGKIDVIGYGPQGPPGPPGPPGSGVVVAWPVVAPPIPEGNIHFTPSNVNIAGLRPTTDANSWIRFWEGPPTTVYLRANSGPLTSGNMGEIYLDADRVFVRSSDGGTALANFTKTGGAYFPNGIASQVLIRAQDGAYEGGEIAFQGAGGHVGQAIWMDRYANDLRIVYNGGNIISFSNGTIGAASLNIAGTSWIGTAPGSVVVLGNAQDARVQIGNDAELYDVGHAHTIALRSITDFSRGTLLLGGASGSRILGMPTYWQIIAPPAGNGYLDAGTMFFRAADGTQFGFVDGSGYQINGTRAFRFADYGGGWFMQDTLWMRAVNDKGVWLGGGYFGTDGGITIGRGGITDATWRAYFQCNVFCTSMVTSYELEGRGVTNDLWSASQGLRVNPSTLCAGISLHPGGVANVTRINQNDNRLHVFDSACTSWIQVVAGGFVTASALRFKKDIVDLPIPRPVDVARRLTPIWFKGQYDLVEPVPINDEHGKLIGSDFVEHDCDNSIHCEGTSLNPCERIISHNRGRVSLSAEQVEEIFPFISSYSTKGELMGYDLVGLVSLLVGAIRNLADDVDYLKGLAA